MSDWFGVEVDSLRRYLVGDLLAILAFILIGEISHGVDPVAQWRFVLDAAIPFLIGWLVVGPLLGAYARWSLRGPLWAALAAVPAWLVADGLGQLLRDTDTFHGSADPVFYLVAAAVGGALLVGWRLVVSGLATR
jgi:hypothetical protein